MERNLKELTLDKMLNHCYIEFYNREINYDIIRRAYLSEVDARAEVQLLEEQMLSDRIYKLLEFTIGKPLEDIRYVRFDSPLGLRILYSDNTEINVSNEELKQGIYKYFKYEGINKGGVLIKQSKYSYYWEVGIGKDFDYDDVGSRIFCCKYLLESVINIIRYNLVPII